LTQQSLVEQSLLIFEVLLSHFVIHTTLDRTSLDRWSARSRDFWQHTARTTERRPCPGGNRTRTPNGWGK